MHYYQFNIGDYASHTQHLDEIEDVAYRRMLDYCYLNEIGLPKSVDEVARLIRMRTHSERNANHKPLTINHKPIKESRASPFTPPTVQEVSDYLFEKGMTFDPERFVDFYESKGWLVGKTKMKCWKAAARTWSKRDDGKSQTSRQSSIRDDLTDTSWAN